MYDPEIEQYLEQCRSLVARETFMVNINDKGLLPYAYTVGLTPLLNCELVAVGQDPDAARIVLNEMAGHLLSTGDLADGVGYDGDCCTGLKLAPVALDFAAFRLFSMLPALGYMPGRLRQVLVSTADRRFPGETGYAGPVQDLDCCLSRQARALH